MNKLTKLFLTLIMCLLLVPTQAQEEDPFVAYDLPTQNLVKFNRYLLNPTFSTVRENKSYINLFHRNQSVSFDDNAQTYFLSYSGRIGDRSGVGVSLYNQTEGVIDNYGLLANYAYGVKLSEKSNLTFGANFSYYKSGINQNRASTLDPDDPLLRGSNDISLITVQPGFNLSYGQFDVGVVANNLFEYNLKTSEDLTDFASKTFTGHLQYTYEFKKANGLLESGRLMPLARVQSLAGEDINLGGSLILDLPKIGWLQAGYDDYYGAAAGVGFNLNKRISIGYTVEKGLSNNLENFGVNHEISLAYSFTPTLTEDRVLLEKDNEDLVSNDEEETPIEELTVSEKDIMIAELQQKLAENDAILDELLFRQDSIESTRQQDLERRFAMVMKMVKRETQGSRPDIEQRAQAIYLANADQTNIGTTPRENPINYSDTQGTSDAYATNATTTVLASDYGNATNMDDVTTTAPAYKKPIRLADISGTSTTATIAEAKEERTQSIKDNTKYTKRYKNFKTFEIPDVESGSYVIANVYKGTKYMTEFMDQLQNQGIETDYFTNPRNGMNYVYIKGIKTKEDAIAAHKSNLNGTYSGNTWVMTVKNDYTEGAYVDNIPKSSTYDDNLLQQNVQEETQNGVAYKTLQIDGLRSGYYIVANVFANPRNATRFIKQLNDQGLNASYFINPENNYRYVYLKAHNEWTDALVSYYSNINNAYIDPMWIMRVKSNRSV
ncbi:type IX secretion system membrane protein PorP/SprF [Croceivirga sp. JEA036]|uniref:PorP/SprF family type IX secretion system membrane protein n=1 Tax=Croceivirga sp. JEA036 TaxID=2721162 RepID=UPI00143C7B08|nr:type IX secretion system membrane protein PorP/SprF [Croceivirga sp. JEA036]NJB37047.1 type IX secretion system membrane protein PorP/SprF [Croceivirga sp. JEA036]